MEQPSAPQLGQDVSAYITVAAGSPMERMVLLRDRVFVGRECSGVDDDHRILVDDPEVSRHHLEIRLDPEGQAWVIDGSTNGSKLNGVRLERAVAVSLADRDLIRVGATELTFRISRPVRAAPSIERSTIAASSSGLRVLVVGDVVGYTSIAQQSEGAELVSNMHRLFSDLRVLLRRQLGTLADVPGDAFFAYWEPEAGCVTMAHAVEFALDADALVRRVAPDLTLRNADGTALTMGWAVVAGVVAISPNGASVLGDATNLAFRLSALSGREGRPRVLVTRRVRDTVGGGQFAFAEGMDVAVKGRLGTEMVFGVESRPVIALDE